MCMTTADKERKSKKEIEKHILKDYKRDVMKLPVEKQYGVISLRCYITCNLRSSQYLKIS